MKTLNEITIQYSTKDIKKERITCSGDACTVLRSIYVESGSQIEFKEYFYILLLNRANKVIGYHKLSEGGINGTIADVRIAFATALKCAASGMILCHNHPSGNTEPSEQDLTLTKKFVEAGKLLDVPVLDHIILTFGGSFSFADGGKI